MVYVGIFFPNVESLHTKKGNKRCFFSDFIDSSAAEFISGLRLVESSYYKLKLKKKINFKEYN